MTPVEELTAAADRLDQLAALSPQAAPVLAAWLRSAVEVAEDYPHALSRPPGGAFVPAFHSLMIEQARHAVTFSRLVLGQHSPAPVSDTAGEDDRGC